MKLQHILHIAASCLFLHACGTIEGKGPVKLETRPTPGTFNAVDISSQIDVRIDVGPAASLQLEGYANLLPHIRTEVKDGTLRIYTANNTDIHTDKRIIATVSLPSLAGLGLSGASDAVVTGVVSVPEFSLDASGACSIRIAQLQVRSFEASMSGSSKLSLGNGTITNGEFSVSGSGEIEAGGVMQQNTSLEISGSGEAEVAVSGKLDVEISGSGEVRYKGHPVVTQEVSGSGSVKRMD